MIPLSIPHLSGNEWKYIKDCLDTNWVSSVGSYVNKFEEEFAKYIGTEYAIGVVNGTAALHLSLILCDVSPGDEVIIPNLTFVAPANAVKYCFATPVFMDSEWATLGMDVNKLNSFLRKECEYKNGFTFNKTTGARVKAIIPMHTLGYPVDMDPLLEICEKYNIDVIEDATESLGSRYKGRMTGALGKLACFSFNGNKIITTGGGGMITTNNAKLARRAKHISSTAKTNPVEFDHDEVGYNYRLVNVLAAMGLAQLERIDEFVKIKRKNLLRYKELIEPINGFSIHTEPPNSISNYWMYSLVKDDSIKYSVMDLVKIFETNQIQVRPVWKLMNTLPMFRDCYSYHCDVSKKIYKSIVSLPCSTNLKNEDIERVVDVIKFL